MKWRVLAVASVAAASVALGAGSGRASAAPQEVERKAEAQGAAAAETQLVVPTTYEEHVARAESYRTKAAEYRAEAESHRKMLEDYRAKEAHNQTKAGIELPWVGKMRKHCEKYMNEAKKLAKEADSFAEFHTMRAAEMRGK